MIRKKSFIYYFILISISIFLGIIIGHDMKNNFLKIYIGMFEQLPFRYVVLILTIIIDTIFSKKIRRKELIFRNKSIFNLFIKNSISMIICISILFLFINIPILIMNTNLFFYHILLILVIYIHSILISFIFTLLIKLIDVFVKNKSISSIIFILIYIILDFYLENFDFYFANSPIFTLNSIYTVPFYINSVYIILIEFIFCFFLISLFMNISIRKDYFAYEKNENNR